MPFHWQKIVQVLKGNVISDLYVGVATSRISLTVYLYQGLLLHYFDGQQLHLGEVLVADFELSYLVTSNHPYLNSCSMEMPVVEVQRHGVWLLAKNVSLRHDFIWPQYYIELHKPHLLV